MGKTGKWLKSFLTGKKEKDLKSNKNTNVINDSTSNSSKDPQNPKPPVVVVVPRPTTPNKEKKRWSFRRSSASNTTAAADATNAPPPTSHVPKCEPTKTAELVAEVTPQQEVVVVVKDELVPSIDREGAAALRIQAIFRSYLARKALKALRGLVKLQALVRGHLVRKQATATLRCMQALVTAQARARAQRIRDSDEGKIINHRQSMYTHTRNSIDKIKHHNFDMEENIKIVEMDQGEYNSNHNNRNSYSTPTHQQIIDPTDFKMSAHSPAPSAITDMSPRTCSNHFEDYSFFTAQSSPQCYSTISRASPLDPSRNAFSFPRPEFADTMSYDFPLYPNYMANTESSRAKVRSQSAPKQRPPEFERQPSRGRRPSVEGRNIPKAAKMLRSSSHVGSNVRNHQFPWSVNLEKSSASLKGSECGSTCSVATNAYYCRSVVSYDPRC